MRLLRVAISSSAFALVVAIAIWESDNGLSPGPLHPSHARVPDLGGGAGCRACHGDSVQVVTCDECHEKVRQQVADEQGLHGTLEKRVAAACSNCHREHAGGHVPLVASFSFELANAGNGSQFDHGLVAENPLAGKHERLECPACHTRADAPVLAAGESRFGGLSPTCTSCHEDPHRGELGSECARCHGQEQPFDTVGAFAHDPSFPLSGAHAGHTCRKCHEVGSRFSVEAYRETAVRDRACQDCHDSPHEAVFLAAAAPAEGRPGRDACRACHDAVEAGFRLPAARITPEQHAVTGFPLVPPHSDLECSQCHGEPELRVEPSRRFAVRHPGREASDCQACHGDPHEGQFDAGQTAGRCIACHADSHFAPSAYTVEMHSATGFPLTNAHGAVACGACHPGSGPGRRFAATPTTCDACHEDVHGGLFDGPGKPVVVAGRRGCARCHDTTSFHDIHLSGAEHGRWTGYELVGKHARAACVDCHEPDPAAGSRKLGKAEKRCDACHVDVHAGQFDRRGDTDCQRCHDPAEDFHRVAFFDHQRDSRFALDEHHRTLACNSCHKPVQARTGVSIVRYRPLGTRCQDCHDDRRGEQGGRR